MESTWPLWVAICVIAAAALVTAVAGFWLTSIGDTLADRLKIGEALFGAIFFGAIISISGIVMTATAGAQGYPRLAYSNAVGGVAAQTVALGVADLVYKKANLEHAAASLPNALSATLVLSLLTMVLLIGQVPAITLFGIHPGSLFVVVAYAGGLWVVRGSRDEPFWRPTKTAETVEDTPDEDPTPERSTVSMVARFVVLGAIVSVAGWAVARSSASIVEVGGLDESFVGAAIMGITNAMPEIVTSIAAVRRGAVTLAVGGILGGNAFDVLNVVVGDIAFRDGSIYHAAGPDETMMSLVAVLLTAVILAGLLRRQRHGPANIGFEGIAMGVIYMGALALIGFT
jgi:cation:H+ antiporter